MKTILHLPQSIFSEWLKTKNTPARWMVILVSILIVLGISIFYLLNAIGLVELNVNPWDRFLNLSFASNSIFLMQPFIILLTAYVCQLENQSNTWKYLYTLPIPRAEIYLSKFLMLVLFLVMTLLIYFSVAIGCGYLIDLIYPEYEFRFYVPDLILFTENIFKLFISLLGVMSFQYWLSMNFKNFIIPLAIGFLGFFIGFMLFASSSKYGQFFPYSFPMMIRKSNMVKDSGGAAASFYQVSGVISIVMVFVFMIIGMLQVKRKNIE